MTLGPADQEHPPSACAVPAQILTKNEWDDPVSAVLVPPEADRRVHRQRNQGIAERQPVDMHVRSRPAILILPGRGLECRQRPGSGLSHNDAGLPARERPARERECLKPHSGLAADGRLPRPGAEPGPRGRRSGCPRSAAEDVSSPVPTVGRLAGLLRESLPTRNPGSEEALRFQVEMDVHFPGSLRVWPGGWAKNRVPRREIFGRPGLFHAASRHRDLSLI